MRRVFPSDLEYVPMKIPTMPMPTELADVIALHREMFAGWTMQATENEPPAQESESTSEEATTLGDSGKKALQAEREARKQADKKAAELQAQLDAINAEKLSDLERAQQAQAQAEKDAADARRDALRYRLAAKHGVSEEDAALFLTGDTEEAMTAQAERLAARHADEERKQQNEALVDPDQGGGRPTAPLVQPGVPRLAAAFDSAISTT